MRPRRRAAGAGRSVGTLHARFQAPWNLRRVVHLHRRAGFAATWDEIQRDLNDGPEASINRLLDGKSRSCGVPVDFAAFADAWPTGPSPPPSPVASRPGGSTACSSAPTRWPSG